MKAEKLRQTWREGHQPLLRLGRVSRAGDVVKLDLRELCFLIKRVAAGKGKKQRNKETTEGPRGEEGASGHDRAYANWWRQVGPGKRTRPRESLPLPFTRVGAPPLSRETDGPDPEREVHEANPVSCQARHSSPLCPIQQKKELRRPWWRVDFTISGMSTLIPEQAAISCATEQRVSDRRPGLDGRGTMPQTPTSSMETWASPLLTKNEKSNMFSTV